MATLIGLLPRDELQLVLRLLTDHDIARMTCTCTILRDVSAVHILRRITQSELGQGLLQRVINVYATVTTPVFDDTTQMDWVLDSPRDNTRGRSVFRNYAFPLTSYAMWWSFLRSLRDVTRHAPSSDFEKCARGIQRCARGIHTFNVWARAIRINTWRMYEDCQDYGIDPPDDDFMFRTYPAHGFASLKKVLMENQLFSRLVNLSGLMNERDLSADLEWSSFGPHFELMRFAEGTGLLETDCPPCSWVLWAVYGCVENDCLMDAFMQVVLGFADMDTFVPAALRSCDSTEIEVAGRYRPLRDWLREHQPILGAPIISLFYRAAGEEYVTNEDEDGGWNPSDDEDTDDGNEKEKAGANHHHLSTQHKQRKARKKQIHRQGEREIKPEPSEEELVQRHADADRAMKQLLEEVGIRTRTEPRIFTTLCSFYQSCY